ncbi:LacI family DNA-binding transcriptional regulator [Phyllobacterium phragmitis]
MTERAKIKDIAKRAGVSIATWGTQFPTMYRSSASMTFS